MDNPFKFGKVVEGEDFADRQDEIRELIKEVKEGQGVFLISPRRFGKTSLILETLKRLKEEKDFYTAHVDLYKASSLLGFLELYANQVLKEAESLFEKASRLVRQFFSAFRPQISVSPDGSWTFSFGLDPGSQYILNLQEAVYELPEKIASRRSKKFVVAFDEFQEIGRLDGDQIERMMRSHFQRHRNVGYIFAGSKESILKDMALREERAFYKFGRIMELKPIPRDEFRPFLTSRFAKGGFILEEGLMDAILDLAEDVPYNVQRICHELWDLCKGMREVRGADLENALKVIIMHDDAHFIDLWDTLPLHQRKLLEAIATTGGSKIFSRDFIIQHRLISHSSVQTSLRRLLKLRIVTGREGSYNISDAFFRMWILERLGKKVTT